ENAILRANPATDGAGRYAATIHKAAETLQATFKKFETPPGPTPNLAVIKSLNDYNVILPRILQAVHMGLAKKVGGIPGARTSDEYLAKIEDAKRQKNNLLQRGVAPSAPEVQKLDAII